MRAEGSAEGLQAAFGRAAAGGEPPSGSRGSMAAGRQRLNAETAGRASRPKLGIDAGIRGASAVPGR